MNKQIIICPLLAVTAAIWSVPVNAQSPWYVAVADPGVGYTSYAFDGGFGAGVVGYGFGYGYGLGNFPAAQTSFSVDMSGLANLVRGQGLYNEETAKAMVNYEQARAEYTENQQKAFSARLAIKRMAQADDAKQREEEHSTQLRVSEFIATHKPLPLTQSQLDPATGRIEWPVILKTKDFEEFRLSLDSMFETRAKSGQTPALSSQISKKTGEMTDELRKQILSLPLPEYSEARRFLDSMAVSAH